MSKTESQTIRADVYSRVADRITKTEQIEGLPGHYYAKPEPKGDPLPLIEAAEAFFTQTGARFQHGGDKAFYAPRPRLHPATARRGLQRR